jgi:hypothetical protein
MRRGGVLSYKERKRFFLKKESKTFAYWGARWIYARSNRKSFLVLFFKKEPLS